MLLKFDWRRNCSCAPAHWTHELAHRSCEAWHAPRAGWTSAGLPLLSRSSWHAARGLRPPPTLTATALGSSRSRPAGTGRSRREPRAASALLESTSLQRSKSIVDRVQVDPSQTLGEYQSGPRSSRLALRQALLFGQENSAARGRLEATCESARGVATGGYAALATECDVSPKRSDSRRRTFRDLRKVGSKPRALQPHGQSGDLQNHTCVILGLRTDRVAWTLHVGKRSQNVVGAGARGKSQWDVTPTVMRKASLARKRP
jgi:hypothetical protein